MKKSTFLLTFCLVLFGCAPNPTNTIDNISLTKYEIEEGLKLKIKTDIRLKTLGNKFNNEFNHKCKEKKNYIGLSLISKKK